MTAIIVLLSLCAGSTIAVAFLLSRGRAHGQNSGRDFRGALKFLSGPFPLSVAMHVTVLLMLIISVHESRGRDLLMVNYLEAGGGGGSEMRDLDFHDDPMPDVAPSESFDHATAVDTSSVLSATADFVRDGGGIGSGGTAGGFGTGHGSGMGSGWRGFIGDLRRKGLDVVLVLDGTGSMSLIIDDVKAKMTGLIASIHNLVPTARVGIVVYGGHGEPIDMQPLTLSPAKLTAFLGGVAAKGGDEWEEDTAGAIRTAVVKMDWRPYAKKVIVLVGDSPPSRADFPQVVALIKQFRAENGVVNAVDVSAEEHERFERALWIKVHREEPKTISPLPAFYRQTESAYNALSQVGGGTMKSLSHDEKINQQVLILAFGDNWEDQLRVYSAK